MNLFLSIILIFFSVLILFTGFTILKDRFEFILRFEKLFRIFLDLQQNSADFYHSFFQSLCTEMKNFFKAKASFLYLIDGIKIELQSENMDRDIKTELKNYIESDHIVLSKKDLINIRKARITSSIFNKLIYLPKKDIFRFKKILILPIVQEKTMLSFFVFLYKRSIPYLKARKIIWLHKQRLSETLLSITNVTKNKDQNIFNIMLDNIRDYSFITSDITHRITSWNKGSEIMFGYDYDEVFGKNLFDLIYHEDRVEFERALEISKKKEETKLKIRMQDCNNNQLICEILIKQVKLNEISMGFYILIKDISKEEVLKLNMKKKTLINRSIVENARDGIILLNSDNKVIFYNEKIKHITHTKMSFLGMEIPSLFPKDFGKQIIEKVREVRNNWIDFQYLDLKFGELWFNVRFFPIIEDQQYQGVIMFFIDNTLRMYTRMELETQKEELVKINQDLIENMESARIMQQNLIPHFLPNNKMIEFDSIYRTSDMLGGDFFYVEQIHIDDKDYYIGLVTDVSGHGVTASMFSVLVKNIYSEFIIRLRSLHDLSPTQLLQNMNEKIINLNLLDSNTFSSKFITVFIYVLNLNDKRLSFSSAGHPRSVLLSEQQNSVSFLGIRNSPPLGLYEELEFQEDTIDLHSGDKLILYTDGLLDILPEQSSYEPQLEHYFKPMISENIHTITDTINRNIKNLEENVGIEMDDITVLLTDIK